MANPIVCAIDLNNFKADPYPQLAKMRTRAPIAYVLQLDSTLFTRQEDIAKAEKI